MGDLPERLWTVFCLILRACGLSGRQKGNMDNRLFGIRVVIFSEIHLENNGFYAKNQTLLRMGSPNSFSD